MRGEGTSDTGSAKRIGSFDWLQFFACSGSLTCSLSSGAYVCVSCVQGHKVSVELTNGEIYRGMMVDAEDTMNLQLQQVVRRQTHTQQSQPGRSADEGGPEDGCEQKRSLATEGRTCADWRLLSVVCLLCCGCLALARSLGLSRLQTLTGRDGKVSHLDYVYIRGSKIRLMILPDMLKNAPMFKRFDPKNKVSKTQPGLGFGFGGIQSAVGGGRGRGGPPGRGRGRGQ